MNNFQGPGFSTPTNLNLVSDQQVQLAKCLTSGLPENLGTLDLKLEDMTGPFFPSEPSYLPGPGPFTCRSTSMEALCKLAHDQLAYNSKLMCTVYFTLYLRFELGGPVVTAVYTAIGFDIAVTSQKTNSLQVLFICTFTVVHYTVPCRARVNVLSSEIHIHTVRCYRGNGCYVTLSPYPCPILGPLCLSVPLNPYVILRLAVSSRKSAVSYAPGRSASP